MEFLMDIPFALRILIPLVLILVVHRFSGSMVAALIPAVLLLGLWIGHDPASLAVVAWERLSSLDNVLLLILILSVLLLSSLMKESGVIDRLVRQVRLLVSHRSALAVLPALIGLLPMPGGAIFSAPMVEDLSRYNPVPGLLKTRINYWFRHIWEYWLPLYPGVLLAIDISGLYVWQLALLHIPFSVVAVTAGYVHLLRRVPLVSTKRRARSRLLLLGLWRNLFPVFILVIVYIIIQSLFPGLATISKFLPILLATATGVLTMLIQHPLSVRRVSKLLFRKKVWVMLAIVALIRIYGAIIEMPLPDGGQLMQHVESELQALGIPLILIIMAIPFVSGITTGIALGFVGASFPIVLSFTGADPGFAVQAATVVLAYSAGYSGMMLSPTHVCLLVTNEYFKTGLFRSIASLVKPVLWILSSGLLFHFLIKAVF